MIRWPVQIKRYGICIFITEKKGQHTRKDKNERLVFWFVKEDKICDMVIQNVKG